MEKPAASTTSIQISHPLHWMAMLRIDNLSSAAKITATEVEKLQRETLNPIINDLLDRPEDDEERRLIYERVTTLNQRLRKDELSTVRLDRFSMLPQELFSVVFGQLGYIKKPWSRAIGRLQENEWTYVEYEKNLKKVLGEKYVDLRWKCRLSRDADVKTKVKAIYTELRAEARKLNRGKDPVFETHPNPLTIEEITLLKDLINRLWTDMERGRSVIMLVRIVHLKHVGSSMRFPDETNFEKEVRFARKWIIENQNIVTYITGVDLRRKNIKVLPPEIELFCSLTTLNLSDNHIRVIPPEIGLLQDLQRLSLRGNQIEAIPPEIGQLTALKELDLSDNQIEAIPPQMELLAVLENLLFSGNPLKAFPLAIGKLTALEYLSLSNQNGKIEIPPEIKRPGLRIQIFSK